MDELLKDSRFAHVAKDPKFRRIPKAERKVKIDKRFQGMFNDKKFAVKYTVDKRGRPVNQTSSENLRKYYDISSSDEESEEEEIASQKAEKQVKKEKTKKEDKKKKKERKVKVQEEEEEQEAEEETEDQAEDDDASSEKCFSSNGALLRIKPSQENDTEEKEEEEQEASEPESDADNESQSSETTAADLTQNESQLHVRRKNENTKIPEKIREKLKDLTVNYARGEGVLLTDSSSDEESSYASDQEDEIEHDWGELDKEAETTDEVTRRLAVCNMDWDRIRAVDLMVLFNSFLPSGGLIRSVTIYPSEFGLQRMKEEEVSGPRELIETKCDSDPEEENDEEGSEYHMEKLRKYQLNRLKYYYAIVEFDTVETANKVYTECDGIEYESSATKLDLRFVPDDMEFDQEPRESCDQLPELSKYQPRQFTTTALQQVKVELTWDETGPERQEIAQKLNSGKLDEIKDSDLQAYLASDTSDDEPEEEEKQVDQDDEEEDNADPVEKYKSLLKEIEEKEEAKRNKDVELEFTWGLGEKEKAEKLVQERMKKDQNLTPFEQFLEKRKAKRKAKKEERKKLKNGNAETNSEDSDLSDGDEGSKKHGSRKKGEGSDSGSSDDDDEKRQKAELELLLMDENADDNKRHFNMKKIEEKETMSKSKQKRLSKKKNGEGAAKEDEFEVNVKDPRFTALFTSHHFNIDPADPHYRKTKGTEALIGEKLKRRADNDVNQDIKEKQPRVDKKLNVELQALVKSVKKKSQNISRPIKR